MAEDTLTKRIIFTFLAIAVSSIPVSAKYSGGSGTAGDPYKIANVADLLALAADTGDYGEHFILTADIDLDPNLPGNQVFTTAVIARDMNNTNYNIFDGNCFTGVFDGAGHKISNLTIDTGGAGNSYLGLFGYVSGSEIKNLGLENVAITGGNYSYYLGGLAGGNDGNISNCYSTGAVTGGDYSSGKLGGLVGLNYEGNISSCYSTGAVTGRYSYCLGGLAGLNDGGTISNCHSTGNVSGTSSGLGGLVGENDGTISNCYSTGAVTGGDNSYLGGLVGGNYYQGIVSNCFSTGAITGGNYSYYLGGLVGWNYEGSISNCYATGAVSGYSNVGGLVGYNDGGGISSSYFLITSRPNNGFGTPLTDAQMKQQSSFVGWDFVSETANGTEDIWRMCINMVNYPLLWWQFNTGDFICPDGVDFRDFAIIANAWLSDPEQVNWNGRCEIAHPPDNVINILDLAIFCDNWLKNDCINCQSTCNYDGYCDPGEASWCPDCGGPICGDGICEPGEEGWCSDCWICGNGICDPGEQGMCPADCPPICGDGICEQGEQGMCPADCPPICGDGICEPGEEGWCSDCWICGNGICDPGEQGVCPADCPPICGDGICEPGEAEGWCPDCPWCGNGICEPGEEGWCPDCQCNYNGICDYWEGPDCPDCQWCGNGICDPGEEGWCSDCPM